MNILFIHQNYLGQFAAIANALAEDGHQVTSLADIAASKHRAGVSPKIKQFFYPTPKTEISQIHHYLADMERQVRRGQEVCRNLFQLKAHGLNPDVIAVHPAWGEALFLREVFPQARIICYCEYFYQAHGGDLGFDAEFPSSVDEYAKIRVRNSTQLISLVDCDQGIAPTAWQRSRYPVELQEKIKVIHEGVNTELIKPNHQAIFNWQDLSCQYGDEVVTYVARNLEPYRGIHSLLRALPALQALRPNAKVVIVGGNEVSYGKRLPNDESYQAKYQAELAEQVDWSKVHFVGKLPYQDYLKLLQISACHVYLTYPFVLSWSLLEAMSAACAIVASDTAPVREVIQHEQNGLLIDFFDYQNIAISIADVLAQPEKFQSLRQQARQTVISQYEQNQQCIPQWKQFILQA